MLILNWKMNGDIEMAQEWLKIVDNLNSSRKLVICPPYPLLTWFKQNMQNLALGAQNCHSELEGAFTGEVSARLLKQIGCEYVIIGHAERRKQGDLELSKKVETALCVGLKVIFCLGESIEIRKVGKTKEFLAHDLSRIKINENVILAYEPLWSIGTGLLPSSEQISEIYNFLTDFAASILYGGSVTQASAANILQITDGILLGKASLDPQQIKGICCVNG